MSNKDKTEKDAAVTGQVSAGLLKIIAFLCGACLMGLEMAGVRLLEPHFGSTIYVWGSIIGIFMGALSIGYFVGGGLADRSPKITVLGGLILTAAIFCFAVPWLANPVCRYLNNQAWLDVKFRALFGSVALYAIPSIFIGMVSPFAVRLAARDVGGVGSVAGTLYAISTLGSIVGTFLVSFVLVEYIGSKVTVWGTGAVLVLVSGICMLGSSKAAAVVALIGISTALGGHYGTRGYLIDYDAARHRVLDTKESVYHNITVINGTGYITPDPVRFLMFNNQIESGIMVKQKEGTPDAERDYYVPDGPIVSAAGYVKLLHLGVLLTGQAPKQVLIIGCGGGVGPQTFKQDYEGTVERIDVVDIDPWVFTMAEKWFNYPMKDDVIFSHIGDGRRFIQNSKQIWDYIILDAYTTGGRIPRHLISKEFFELMKTRLAPEGLVLANVISSVDGKGSRLYRSVFKTMQAVYDPGNKGKIYTFPRNRIGSDGENIILIATPDRAPMGSAEIKRSFKRISGSGGIFKQKELEAIVDHMRITPPLLEDVPLLTDDFCPTDSMVYH